MYTFVKMIAKDRGRTGTWFESSDSNIPVRQISQRYHNCYLVLSNPYYATEVTLDCKDVEVLFAKQNSQMTISQWLVSLGATTLPVTEKPFKLKVDYVRYRDAIQAGWGIDLCHRTSHPSIKLPKSELDDLVMRKEGVAAKRFLDHCLVTVNNLVHLTMEGADDSVQVIDGGVSNRVYNDNHVGILSFEKVGRLSVIPIVPEMVSGLNGKSSLSDLCVIKLPEEYDAERYFPMVSIGGFLHALGSVFSYQGNNCFKVDLGNFGWESRYYELHKRTDLSLLHKYMTQKNGNYDQVSNEELFSDPVLMSLLCMSQSFVVLVDNPNIVVNQIPLEQTLTPGTYLTQSPLIAPVLYNKGLLYDAWEITEMDRSVVKGKENYRPVYNHETVALFDEHSFDDTKRSVEPDRFSMAFQWLIGAATFE